MSVKSWASVAGAGQYLFNPSQYFMLPVPACRRYGHDALNQSWVNVGPLSVTLAHIQRGTKQDTVTDWVDRQTERTGVKQHVPTSVYRGET